MNGFQRAEDRPPETVVLGRQSEPPPNNYCLGPHLECEFSRNCSMLGSNMSISGCNQVFMIGDGIKIPDGYPKTNATYIGCYDNPVFIKVGNRFVNLQDMLNKIDILWYSEGGPGYKNSKEKIETLQVER